MLDSTLQLDLAQNGFVEIDSRLDDRSLELLAQSIGASEEGRSGRRDLLLLPEVENLISHVVAPLLEKIDAEGFQPIGATLFDKRAERNWRVTWHQDLSIPAPGATSDTILKDGVPHIRPSAEELEQVIAARVHLDDAGPSNGGLKVIAGSHRRRIIPEADIEEIVTQSTVTETRGARGSIMLMRPLILHASARATDPSPRRVLHVVLANWRVD